MDIHLRYSLWDSRGDSVEVQYLLLVFSIVLIIMVGIGMMILFSIRSELSRLSKRIDTLGSSIRKTNEWISEFTKGRKK